MEIWNDGGLKPRRLPTLIGESLRFKRLLRETFGARVGTLEGGPDLVDDDAFRDDLLPEPMIVD